MLFHVLNFFKKCVVAEVVLFSIVALKTFDISQGSVATIEVWWDLSDRIIIHFLLIQTVK